MQIILIHIGRSVHGSKLIKAFAIVGDVTSDLQQAVSGFACF